jgi:putative tryptophan/tyrosine transport system substrate-binding protein
MRRRDFVVGLAGVAAWPFMANAQQPNRKIARIGWLAPGSRALQANLDEYRRGMRELGYVEGRTVETTYLYADDQIDRLDERAAMLVADRVDVIVTAGTPGCLAAKKATASIPIVFAVSSDPLSTEVVASLPRPGGNITGLSLMASDLSGKRLELLQAALPNLSQVAVLWDSSNPGMALRVRETRLAADQMKIAFFDAGTRDLNGLQTSFAELSERRPSALVVTAEPFTNRHRDMILDFARKNRLPAIYEDGDFARAGGFMAYGPSIRSMFHRSAQYVDKIIKGAKPADLPVEQPTTFELVVNLKTAREMGIVIPVSFLLRADEVIE